MSDAGSGGDWTAAAETAEGLRLRATLRVIGWTIVAGAVPPIVHNLVAENRASALVLLLAQVGVLLALRLARRGRLPLAALAMVATIQAGTMALVLAGRHGFHDVSMLLFPATLVVAGLLVDRRTYAAVAATTVLFVSGIGAAEVGGWLVNPLSRSTYARNVLDSAVILAVTAVAVGLLTESLRMSLVRARRHEAALAAANAELVSQAQRLLASEERFRSVIDLAVDGILIASGEGRLIGLNRRLLELTGRSAPELMGRPATDLFPPEELQRAPLRYDRLDRGETVLVERLLRRSDGTTLPVEMSSKRMPDGTYHSFLRDITERRRAEQERALLQDELRHAQKMEAVGRLAGGIAHDFNNMLMVIGSSVDVALLGQEPGTRVHRCLTEVQSATSRAGALTRQLLAFSRKQTVEPRVLDLGELVSNLRPMLAGVLGKGVRIALEAPSRPALVRVDAGQIEQALLNLATNARDAMPDGGRFELAVSELVANDGPVARSLGLAPGRYVALRVMDTGSGMSEDVRRRLFEPFFTTKPKGKGTGLGLAMVYGAVTQSGGAIGVDSAPGRGTTFRVLLPCAQPRARDSESPEGAAAVRTLPSPRRPTEARAHSRASGSCSR